MEDVQRKYLIVDALNGLLEGSDLSGVTIKDLTKAAGISRQTFYRHFRDKYHVVNWYYDREVEVLFEQTLSVSGIQDNLYRKLRLYESKKRIYQIYYRYEGQNDLRKHEFTRIYNSLIEKVSRVQGVEVYLIDLDIVYAIEFFCHGLIQVTVDWLNRSCPISSDQLTDLVIDLMPKTLKEALE